jgi:hypothetical protein
MFVSQYCRGFVLLALTTSLSAVPALADSPVRFSEHGQSRLARSSAPARSWMSPGVASSNTQLVYASLINSVSTGETNVYEVAGSTLKLVGQLAVGGGPITVDRDQNVYVSDTGGDVLKWRAHTVYEFARGATKPKLVLHPNRDAWNIVVAYDGTVYVAGASLGAKHLASIVRFAPGTTSGTPLPANFGALEDGEPTGMAVDSAGDLFVGWDDAGSPPQCNNVCVLELPAGKTSWQTLLSAHGPANSLIDGPFRDGSGNLVVFTDNLHQQLMLTFVPGGLMPTRAVVIPLATGPLFAAALDAGGRSLWGENTLFNTSTPYTIYRLDYPSGTVALSFPIPQSTTSIPADEGIAVSPAFYP